MVGASKSVLYAEHSTTRQEHALRVMQDICCPMATAFVVNLQMASQTVRGLKMESVYNVPTGISEREAAASKSVTCVPPMIMCQVIA